MRGVVKRRELRGVVKRRELRGMVKRREHLKCLHKPWIVSNISRDKR